jgi:hypothetical protein
MWLGVHMIHVLYVKSCDYPISHLEVIGDGSQGVDLAGLAVEEEQAAVERLDKRVSLALAIIVLLRIAIVVSGIPFSIRVGVLYS